MSEVKNKGKQKDTEGRKEGRKERRKVKSKEEIKEKKSTQKPDDQKAQSRTKVTRENRGVEEEKEKSQNMASIYRIL